MASSTPRHTVEDCWRLDVNQLHRDGCLEPDFAGIVEWHRHGSPIARISIRMDDSHLALNYQQVAAGAEDIEDIEDIVQIIQVPCPYGGSRPYFLCPGVANGVNCDRRVACLYLADRYFLCRHCNRLTYTSQRENALARAARKASKLRACLGDPLGWPDLPPRPKGMWHSTFQRWCARIDEAEEHADEAFSRRFNEPITAADPT